MPAVFSLTMVIAGEGPRDQLRLAMPHSSHVRRNCVSHVRRQKDVGHWPLVLVMGVHAASFAKSLAVQTGLGCE